MNELDAKPALFASPKRSGDFVHGIGLGVVDFRCRFRIPEVQLQDCLSYTEYSRTYT